MKSNNYKNANITRARSNERDEANARYAQEIILFHFLSKVSNTIITCLVPTFFSLDLYKQEASRHFQPARLGRCVLLLQQRRWLGGGGVGQVRPHLFPVQLRHQPLW